MLSLSRVRWHEITFDSGLIPYLAGAGHQVWYDSVTIDGQDRFNPTTAFALYEAPGGRWITDSIVTNLQDGAQGFNLMRNVAISNTLTGGPWSAPFIVNTTVTRVDPGNSGAHPDVWRSTSSMRNVIIYGFHTPLWNLQGGSLGLIFFTQWNGLLEYDDVALVDCNISSGSGIGAAFGIGGVVRHMYISDSVFRGAIYVEQPPNLSIRNMVVERTQFQEYSSGNPIPNPSFPGATYR